jgi:pilus assembly protein CpaC
MSGETADFLAGGEVPYTVVDGNGNPTIQFKQYGVQLNFTPTIKSGGQVSLVVKSSVSEPTGDEGAINRRDVSTTVELAAGQTLSIAGLLDNRTTASVDRLPGLGDIPILGALFRSREFRNSNTELVFLVTPYIAHSTSQPPVLPTDKMALANDAEAVFLGHIESIYGVGPAGTRGSYDGSVGFLLD